MQTLFLGSAIFLLVLMLLIGLLYGNIGMFVDIAIAYALLNFIATLGMTKYFLRRKEIHLQNLDEK